METKIQPQHSWITLVVLVVGLVPCVAAQQEQPELVPWEILKKLDLDQLVEIEVVVTSVAKKPQKRPDTPAAVFVVAKEEIRRSGATSIPELLRMVPGVQVARLDVEAWAISARGFNDFFANKLLVLIDGRSVYTPLFSGVYWDMQDTLLEDVDRIEVIRGPGGTIWGANAVNGVINIITKNARDTQGGLVVAGGGAPQERGFGSLRYGGALSEDAHYRVFMKGFYRDEPDEAVSFSDDWRSLRGGFRIDWDLTPDDATSFQGEAYGNQFKEFALPISFDPPSLPLAKKEGEPMTYQAGTS